MSHENASNKPLIWHVNRQQMSSRAVDVEELAQSYRCCLGLFSKK